MVEPVRGVHVFFHARLRSSLSASGVRLEPDLEVYVVGVLADLCRWVPSELFAFALFSAEGPGRPVVLKEVGDGSLVWAGLFPRHLSVRGISRDHCVRVGSMAYRELASWSRRTRLAPVYGALASSLPGVVMALEHLGEGLGRPDGETVLLPSGLSAGLREDEGEASPPWPLPDLS